MAAIDSANVKCDGCGVIANHPVMYWPEGWVSTAHNKEQLCPDCVETQESLTGERLKSW